VLCIGKLETDDRLHLDQPVQRTAMDLDVQLTPAFTRHQTSRMRWHAKQRTFDQLMKDISAVLLVVCRTISLYTYSNTAYVKPQTA